MRWGVKVFFEVSLCYKGVRMRFVEIDSKDFSSGFLYFCKESLGKKQPQGVATPWASPGMGAVALLRCNGFPPTQSNITPAT